MLLRCSLTPGRRNVVVFMIWRFIIMCKWSQTRIGAQYQIVSQPVLVDPNRSTSTVGTRSAMSKALPRIAGQQGRPKLSRTLEKLLTNWWLKLNLEGLKHSRMFGEMCDRSSSMEQVQCTWHLVSFSAAPSPSESPVIAILPDMSRGSCPPRGSLPHYHKKITHRPSYPQLDREIVHAIWEIEKRLKNQSAPALSPVSCTFFHFLSVPAVYFPIAFTNPPARYAEKLGVFCLVAFLCSFVGPRFHPVEHPIQLPPSPPPPCRLK